MGALERMSRALVPVLAAWLIRLLRRTLRLRHHGREALDRLEADGRHYIHAFWHGHLALMAFSYRGPRIAILISRHRDGEYIARTMERLGFDTIRGSSTRGGAMALRAAVRRLREGWDLAITPDGPRGPRHVVQPGVIEAARLSGAPVVPVVFAARPAWVVRSWDRFVIPRPFARGLFLYGEPMEVPRDASPEARESLRRSLEDSMIGLSVQAEREVRRGPGRAGEH
jgi:lysophospholipid acyltransferase (LPLAT)-like uncharacterized protein